MGNFWDGPDNSSWQNLASRLEEQTRVFWAIDSISTAINSTQTTEELLQSALGRIAEVTGAHRGGIYVPQPDGTWLLAVRHNLPDDVNEKRAVLAPDEPALRLVLESGGPVTRSERLEESGGFVSRAAKDAGTQSWAAITIMAVNTIWGVLTLSSHNYNAFNTVHLELLRVVSQLLGLSISNAVMHEKALVEADSEFRGRVAEMETVLGSMSDGLLMCDNSGTIVRANRAAARILGMPMSSLVGSCVLSGAWRAASGEHVDEGEGQDWPLGRVFARGEECRNYHIRWVVREDQRVLSLTASPVRRPGGGRDGAVILVRDITEEREADAMKEEFLSILSHELRGPLTVISGYAQMLSRRLGRLGLQEEVNYVSLVKENALRMSGMVGDLVDSGRLESGVQAINKEPGDLGALVMSVAGRISTEQSHAPNFHTVDVRIEPDLPQVEMDARRIDQVLTNLITNAVKYSPTGGAIMVAVERTPPDKHFALPASDYTTAELSPASLMVSVTDQGAGVPPEERRRIFDRAYRGDRGKEISAQGLGLGLYISRLAVEAHGGHIGVEEGPGGVGSTFWFTVPLE
ncbi:MAG: ATP-binding protein [Chloroflexota bacterium]|nr:ATP-binding protein [Chloroflexota bacterium]MDQ5867430.1 ATP-binding protein [Chloroflexota bacterium]